MSSVSTEEARVKHTQSPSRSSLICLRPKRKSDVLSIDDWATLEGPKSPSQPSAPSTLQLSGLQRLQQSQSLLQDHDPAFATSDTFAKEAAQPSDSLPAGEDEAHDARRYALDLDTNPPLEGQKTAPIYVGKMCTSHCDRGRV